LGKGKWKAGIGETSKKAYVSAEIRIWMRTGVDDEEGALWTGPVAHGCMYGRILVRRDGMGEVIRIERTHVSRLSYSIHY
jgi:hypothetical protein